jgi:DNA-binding IclR family transcriptional regulator
MRDAPPQGTYRVQALDRAFAVLDLLGESETPLGLAQVASSLQLHKSTAHRFLMVLERHAYGGTDDQRKIQARAPLVRLWQPRD